MELTRLIFEMSKTPYIYGNSHRESTLRARKCCSKRDKKDTGVAALLDLVTTSRAFVVVPPQRLFCCRW